MARYIIEVNVDALHALEGKMEETVYLMIDGLTYRVKSITEASPMSEPNSQGAELFVSIARTWATLRDANDQAEDIAPRHTEYGQFANGGYVLRNDGEWPK